MVLDNKKELEFFKTMSFQTFLVPPGVSDWNEYWENYLHDFLNELRHLEDDLHDEIRSNLLLLPDKDQRRAYLLRLNVEATKSLGSPEWKAGHDDIEIEIDASELGDEYSSSGPWLWKLKYVGEASRESRVVVTRLITYIAGLLEAEYAGTETSPSKDSLTLKQQILLLEKLGFFDLDEIRNNTAERVGIMLSHLLNKSQKNSYDNYRERYNTEKGGVNSSANNTLINSLLAEINWKKK